MLRRTMMAAASSGGDPHWGSVISCLNFIGSDGATSTTDAKGLPWTFSGNAQIDTAASANGTSSLLLDGSGDYISTPDTDGLRVDVNAWTMEAFVRRAGSKLQCIATKRTSSGGAREYMLIINDDNNPAFFAWDSTAATSVNMTAAVTIPTGSFVHLAVVRNGTTWYMFVNGVLEATQTQTSVPVANSSRPLIIGRDPTVTPGRDFDGWIGGFRRTNVARWTSGFAPPTAPFPTS